MEVNLFSARSQNLTLVSCNSSFSWLNPTSLQSIRRDFLRPPGAGRKCKKLALFHTQSPPFLVRASLDSNPNSILIIVALFTFSAVSAAYFNRLLKNKESSKKVSATRSDQMSQLSTNVKKLLIENQAVVVQDSERGTSTKEPEYLKDSESNQSSEEKIAPLHFQEARMVHDGTLYTETSNSLGANCIGTNTSTNVFPEESETTSISSPPIMPPGIVPSSKVATEVAELQFETNGKQTELDSEFPGLTVKAETNASMFPVHVAHTKVNEERKVHNEVNDENQPTSFGSIFIESIKREQFILNGANQAVVQFPANLSALKAISSQASPLNSYSLLSLKMNNEVKAAASSVRNSLQTAEYVEEDTSVTSHKGGSSYKRKDTERGRGFPRGKEGGHLMRDDNKNLPQFPYSSGRHGYHTNNISDPYSTYNRLIRNERLTDCINLLEDMRSRDLLDMDKVYHARFFNVCKSQKAVKDAFCFMSLISNPTLSTFNMLMSVCANSQDSEGAFQVLRLVKEAGLKADCKLYTTLISTCAKSGKVDAMFEVFHEMVNAGVEPNVHTYGALIDGCAKAGQVAKAFGAYGIMRSKNVKPDRVVFNALISACGQTGAVDRAFDVLAEMSAETQPIDPDDITVGALIKACANASQVDRAREVYKMMEKYNIKGTPEVYTIAINCCCQTGDWEFASNVYGDMIRKEVIPDEVFLSALVDAAGHAGKVEAAFEILQEAKNRGIRIGAVAYSSLMGACSNAKNWQKGLELYENMKTMKLQPTVSTMNALITALCDGDQLQKAVEVLSEMKNLGLCPNTITYSVLLVGSERKDDIDVGLMLFSQAKEDGIVPNLIMYKCMIGMCSRRYGKARTLGEDVLSWISGRPQIENKWTSLALTIYREAIITHTTPTMEVFSQVLGCLQLPHNADLKSKLAENLGVNVDSSKFSNLCSLLDGFGEYDPRAFSLLEEAASLEIVPSVSFKESPVVVDARKLQIHTAEVYLLTVLKGLKHRLAAGAKLPSVTILLPIGKAHITSAELGKTINLADRISQSVAALLRRIGLPYQGNGSYGKIRINGLALKRWYQPKIVSAFNGNPGAPSSLNPGAPSSFQLGKGISFQQRNIRIGNLSLE